MTIRKITLGIVIATMLLTTSAATPFVQQQVEAFMWDSSMDKSATRAPIATSGDNLYTAWWGNKTGNWEIMFRASPDGGQTFDKKINLSNSSTEDSALAAIAASGNYVYVGWWEEDPDSGIARVFFRSSPDNGKTFGSVMDLTNATYTNRTAIALTTEQRTEESKPELRFIAQGNSLYGVSTGHTGLDPQSTSASDTFFRVSHDNGKTFGPKINLSNSPGIISNNTELAVEGNNVYVSWWERNQTSNEPVMRISTDAGQTFGPVLMLGTNGTIGSTEEGEAE